MQVCALPPPQSSTPKTLRQRLWLGGTGCALFFLTILIGNVIIDRDRAVTRDMIGHDFLAFYTAGTFVNQGRIDLLYDLDAVKKFENQLAATQKLEASGFGPFWNPPFYALLFAPLARLPFQTALSFWWASNIAALIIAIVLLRQLLPAEHRSDWRSWALIPLLMACSLPFLQAFTHGQNTYGSLLLLTAVVLAWRSGRPLLAGIVVGFLFYKPQLAAVVAAALVLSSGWRALLGVAIAGSALLLITVTLMPGALENYLHQLPVNVHAMQIERTYLWERHVTLKSFWRMLIQGREAGEPLLLLRTLTASTVFALGFWLLATVWRSAGAIRSSISRDRGIAAAVVCTPLLTPFYFDYDLLLLSVPAVLLTAEMLRGSRPICQSDRWLIKAWISLFFWLYINTHMATALRINGTVLLLGTIATLSIARARRREMTDISLDQPQNQPVALAA